MAFVDHLQAQFPKARIRIHNGVSETISLTFARIIMAKQTVVAISSFGVFPALATFGTAFIRKPDYGSAPNQWLLHMTKPLQELPQNVKLVTEPRLTTKDCRTMWGQDGTDVIAWFQNYTTPPLHLDDPSKKKKVEWPLSKSGSQRHDLLPQCDTGTFRRCKHNEQPYFSKNDNE